MANPTGITQIGKPGGLVEPGIQKYGVLDWIDTAVDTYKKYKPLADAAVSLGKGYLDYKSQKELNELSEQAYKDYMAQKQAATQEAQAAIDLNLMPMEVTNIPQTKADVSSFTAVAARGGLMNLPTRQRKRYARGPQEVDVMEMDEEVITPFELQKEEGVPIGPMAGFPDTGDPMSNAQQVWQSGAIDQGIYQMDFNIFFKSGDWQDHISRGTVQGDTQMASAPGIPGIEGLRHGGRPGYEMGLGPVGRGESPQQFMTEEEASRGNPGNAEMYQQEIIDNQTGEIDGTKMINTGDGIKIYIDEKEDQPRIVGSGFQGDEKILIIETDMGGQMLITEKDYFENYGIPKHKKGGIAGLKKGGRVKYAYGSDGIMNLGGLEKDYRTTGGFVPIGAYEKKDDVPARLSKNEFVMTADAVRAAGGGSINKGAQLMYDTMKHLEAQPTAKRMTA